MCTHAAHSLQLASAHTGDEAPQVAKCHLSPQRCRSLHTVPHTVKLGAGADSSWYPIGRLLCPAWAKAIMSQGDFWQHQTIISAFLSSHLYKFSWILHISFQNDSSFLFGWFSYPKCSWSFPGYCLIQQTFIIFGVIRVFLLVGWVGFFWGKYLLKQLWVFRSYTLFTFTFLWYEILLPRLYYQGEAIKVPPQRCSASSLYATTTLLQEQPELRLCTDPVCLGEILSFDDKGRTRSLQTA